MKIEEIIKNKYLYTNGFNFFKLIYFFYQFLKTKKILSKKIFYSNWGLDMLADDFFKKKNDGVFIDIGCHHPFLNNNTYRLYKRGWVGINIDLDTQMIYIPINLSKKIDEWEAIQIINDAGYDTVAIYTNFDGNKIEKKTIPKLVG